MDAEPLGAVLDWNTLTAITDRLARTAAREGRPEVVVGVLRGGMIPAVLIAHAMGLRDVRAVEVTRTVAEEVNARKTEHPMIRGAASLGELAGRDVLVVDDVAGSGQTIRSAETLVRDRSPSRVRTLLCTVNELNWRRSASGRPEDAVTYLGACFQGWVVFPWERHG